MKEEFQNCKMEGHMLREVLTVVHVGVVSEWRTSTGFSNSSMQGSLLTVFPPSSSSDGQ